MSLRRSADGEPLDADRRLSYANRHALPILPAHADAGIEAHVVSDHRHSRERPAVADEGRALHGILDPRSIQ